MLLLPPNFLKQEDKAVEFLSGIFQFLGGAFVLVAGFAASSLAVSCPSCNLMQLQIFFAYFMLITCVSISALAMLSAANMVQSKSVSL